MENKLGLSRCKLNDIEKEIVNLKLNIIDNNFSFNENNFNLYYLTKLNKFLFEDIYFPKDIGIRLLDENDINKIEDYLENLIDICLKEEVNIEDILNIINEIWNLQPFLVGNTRTMVAFLKILNDAFLLNLDIDVNKEISHENYIFEVKYFVNQKRLTKHN